MIGTANYRTATEILAECRDLSFEALGPLLSMRRTLADSDVNPQDRSRLHLNAVIESTYSHIVAKHCRPSQKTLNAVRALNKHVLKYYNHSTLDSFLQEQYLEVPSSYAFLSQLAGYPVSEIGDSAARFKDIDAKFKNINLKFNRIGWTNV